MSYLEDSDWKVAAPCRAMAPYKPAGDKIWRCKVDQAPFREYLLALADAEALFQRGAEAIYHGQIKSYYVCLLKAPSDKLVLFRPNLGVHVYNELACVQGRGRRRARASDFLELGDDAGIGD